MGLSLYQWFAILHTSSLHLKCIRLQHCHWHVFPQHKEWQHTLPFTRLCWQSLNNCELHNHMRNIKIMDCTSSVKEQRYYLGHSLHRQPGEEHGALLYNVFASKLLLPSLGASLQRGSLCKNKKHARHSIINFLYIHRICTLHSSYIIHQERRWRTCKASWWIHCEDHVWYDWPTNYVIRTMHALTNHP